MNTLQPILDFYGNDASRWTQGACARDSQGEALDFYDDKAVSWCLSAAVLQLDNNLKETMRNEICRRLEDGNSMPYSFYDIPIWNDRPSRTFDDVVKILSLQDGQTL